MSGKLTKAQLACLREAARGYVFPPARYSSRIRSGEVGRVPGCFPRRTINCLTARGLLSPVDIETRRITEAGRAALKDNPHG